MHKITMALALALWFQCDPAAAHDPIERNATTLLAVQVAQPPVIDGHGDDAAWSLAEAVTTVDPVANIEIRLKSVYSGDEIFFLVEFPDETESTEHKNLIWSEELGAYRTGPKREDAFVFKWSMQPRTLGLMLSADQSYEADIWYWKACRTGPVGYADDKMHIYGRHKAAGAKVLTSRSGKVFHLQRPGDEGKAAYRVLVYGEFQGGELSRYAYQKPTGSRADIRARGNWHDGSWTVEFRRKLDTGHADDVQFDPTGHYLFGVSRFEIAGRKSDPRVEEPNFGSGEVGKPLVLQFQ